MSSGWVYLDGVRLSYVRSELLLAVVLYWLGRCYCSWMVLPSPCNTFVLATCLPLLKLLLP